MYICEACARQIGPQVKAVALVVRKEPCVYPQRSYQRRGDKRPSVDRGGCGTRIVRQLKVCPDCADVARAGVGV